ncbi:hypothetical protein OEK97_28320, partial [Escherichia coli]|uniref:hypothetical protein n=1 Tax=Escherichia coli TaxID=562 RepID=UPI0021D8B4E0
MEFANLRSELELLTGQTNIVIDDDIEDFNKKHNIKPGILKSKKDLLGNINLLKTILEEKISKLVKKYENIQ